MYKFLCAHVFYPHGYVPRSELPGLHSNIFRNLQSVFQAAVLFISAIYWVSSVYTSLQHFLSLLSTYLVTVKWYCFDLYLF